MKKLPKTLIELTHILSDLAYHDGDTIGQKLGITRSAVWKAIKKLEEYGTKIDSIKGKGYALSEPLLLLDEHLIQQGVPHKNITIEVFESLESTNSYLKGFVGNITPRVCIAEYQTQGRGRLNRRWYSPFGKNIYLSILYPFEKDMSELVGLSTIVSLAIVDALQDLQLAQQIFLKWPNDIIVKQKKLSGSLIEIISEANGLSYAIIGIGLNVNMINDDNHINQSWTSLKQLLNQDVDRNKLCISLINSLTTYLKKFNQEGFNPFKTEWEQRDMLLNKKVKLVSGNNIISGYGRGINNQGNLMLEVEKGYIKPFSSGDTTIIKE
ncbi:bifunctional biotin--[acetyl-CoA-carboxylase] ligase/biotin operon repressor BirA [Rickettsiales endosymbiont of Stachyamoeba lipophora]|uniref:bifunctional biotin--[acetyl-CoA-carboxylase] ligase/biotin operon repressor BirA n=1 Tax=Rickettsiales endosymbiont of Stachyamoeba lipophora TaxID=2486578 RepID=UPI000F653489|nr:bifunctional biotin--[acetyl-CoA-carboxylase] ligase/biotin operon repressor BirA [Rickettsiales endosymbiont of Stachyamoeba lipophora]AZL16080.1 bifunctional biotin--[acetyl-CoA-carboxylase] ligase/biotin operon repressor BirA [Rickettsiales endosymbiont of Stachyamoeba lipophora]